MYMKNGQRTRLTTSLFYSTFVVAVFTVAAPQFLGCPAKPHQLGADATNTGGQKKKTPVAQLQQQSQPENESWSGKSVVIVNRQD